MPERVRRRGGNSGALERGLVRLAEAERRAARQRRAETTGAVHDERLRRLEQDLAELRGRINGLIFLVAGTVVTEVIVRLVG